MTEHLWYLFEWRINFFLNTLSVLKIDFVFFTNLVSRHHIFFFIVFLKHWSITAFINSLHFVVVLFSFISFNFYRLDLTKLDHVTSHWVVCFIHRNKCLLLTSLGFKLTSSNSMFDPHSIASFASSSWSVSNRMMLP